MRSFIRLVMFRRYNNGSNGTFPANGTKRKPQKQQQKVPLSTAKSLPTKDSTSTTSILTLRAIQSINARSMINHHYYSHHNTGSYDNNFNEWYHRSWNGTLGPSTCSYLKMSWKGERTLSRSRLEVCPAIASFELSSMAKFMLSLAFAKEPTPLSLTISELKQII
jgi:hypothetical protein